MIRYHSLPISTFAFLCTVLFLSEFTLFAQTKKDTLVAWEYYQKAEELIETDNHDESILLFKKALLIYKNVGIWERVASCYNKVAANQWRNNQLDASFKNASKAQEISYSYLVKEHAEVANAYDNIANYYTKKWELDKAISFFEKALKIRRKIPSEYQTEIATTYNWMGFVYLSDLKYDKGIEFLIKSKDISIKAFGEHHQKTSDAYKYLAAGYAITNKYEESVRYFKQALQIAIEEYGQNHVKTGYIYLRMGGLYMSFYEFDNALSFLNKSLPILVENNDFKALRIQYSNMAYILSSKGEFDNALEFIKKSVNLTRMYFEEDQQQVASAYRKIGIIYKKKKEYTTALQYFAKSLQIYSTHFGEKHTSISKVYYEIGKIHYLQKEYEKALSFYEKAARTPKSTVFTASLENSIGKVYARKGMYEEALYSYQKSLKSIQEKYGVEHYRTSNAFYRKGTIYLKQKEYNTAISNFEKAIYYNTRNEYKKLSKIKLDPKHYYNLRALLTVLKAKSRALVDSYRKHENKQDFYEASANYKKIETLIDYLRHSYHNYNDKVSFAKEVKRVYYDALQAQLTLYKETLDTNDLAQVFMYAEKSKANTLKELLSDDHAKNSSEIPEALLTKKKILKTKHAFCKSQIVEAQSDSIIDVEKIKTFENELFAINRTQDSLNQVLEKDFPKYYQLKYDNSVLSVVEIQQQLDSKTTLLEFFTGNKYSYVFVISKNKFNIKKLRTPKLKENITKLRAAITSKNTLDYKKIAYNLYEELLAPINERLVGDQLIIVPDGLLWHLNFELLLTEESSSEAPSEFPYLLKDYAVTYANSATLYFNPFEGSKSATKQEGCLAFSFSDQATVLDSQNMSLATLRDVGDDLPGTRKEIKAIANIIDGQYYFGSDASEATFKKNANKYKILHLALHGEVDNENTRNSKLYFTKSTDTVEDNLLYSHELFALNIPAELTVLSACNTGTGKIDKGEGIMSLGNAFQYAGTKSLLLSSWEVPDDTTPELMQYFYTNLKEGMNKAKALQQAKLQYLKTADLYHDAPFYWGGFYLIGDVAPIDFGNSLLRYWVLGFGVFILLFIYWFFLKKQR